MYFQDIWFDSYIRDELLRAFKNGEENLDCPEVQILIDIREFLKYKGVYLSSQVDVEGRDEYSAIKDKLLSLDS